MNVLWRESVTVTADKQTENIDILVSSGLDEDILWGIRHLNEILTNSCRIPEHDNSTNQEMSEISGTATYTQLCCTLWGHIKQ